MIDAQTAATMIHDADGRKAAVSASRAAIFKPRAMTETQMAVLAQDFESMFISQMVGQMFGESVGDSIFGDEESNEIYKNLMVEEYGKTITSAGGIGIASYIKRELLRLQEVQS